MARPGRPATERTGNRYGLVTVIERAGSGSDGSARWLCRCDCGTERVVTAKVLDDFPPTTHNACARVRRLAAAAEQ